MLKVATFSYKVNLSLQCSHGKSSHIILFYGLELPWQKLIKLSHTLYCRPICQLNLRIILYLHTHLHTAWNNLFQVVAACSCLFWAVPACWRPLQLIPSCCNMFQSFSTCSSLFQLFQSFSICSSLFQLVPAHSSCSRLFQLVPASSRLFQTVLTQCENWTIWCALLPPVWRSLVCALLRVSHSFDGWWACNQGEPVQHHVRNSAPASQYSAWLYVEFFRSSL